MTVTCDVVVLGMGTSGEDAALRLARAGLDVVGVEARLIGGECPYWACLPTKSMVRSANLLTEARRADGLVGSVTVKPDWGIIAERIRAEITGGWDDSGGVARFEGKGGTFVRGWGKLIGPRAVEVNGEVYSARIGVLVATGSAPTIPNIRGLAGVEHWTNHDAVATEELPASVVIVGGGAVGCELGQIFARFGSAVTIVEASSRILATEEPEVSGVIESALSEDGVRVMTGSGLDSVEAGTGGIACSLTRGETVVAEKLLLAVGRSVDAENLGITEAGAVLNDGFIEVDDRLRAADGLWAIGDVTGKSALTQVAEYQASIAIEDMLGGDPRPADYSVNPTVVFTDPEVGSVGLREAEAREKGHDVDTVTKNLGATFRGWLHRTGNVGLFKLVVDTSEDRLLGASAVGPSAGEVLGYLALAVRQRVPLGDLVHSIFSFPTFYGGVGEALGAYGRGIVRVLDPDTDPLFDDPGARVMAEGS